MHALPLTYNKDLQEDKEHLFDAVDTLELCLAAATGMIAGARFRPRADGRRRRGRAHRRDRPRRPARARGVPFRECPRRRRRARARGRRSGRALSSCAGELRARPALGEDAAQVLERSARGWSRRSARAGRRWRGSREQLERARARSRADRRRSRRSTTARCSRWRRDLVGCVVRHGDTAGRHRRDRGLPPLRAGLRTPSPGSRRAPRRCSGRPGVAYVYRSYGIHALLNAVCEPTATRRRGPDPRARAARRHRGHARAPARRRATRSCAPARAS